MKKRAPVLWCPLRFNADYWGKLFRYKVNLPIFDVNINGNAVNALAHQHPAMSLAGILLGILIIIGKNQHTLGDDDVKGAELLRRTVFLSLAIFTVLLIVKIVSLALTLLDFPLVFDCSLLVFAL
jgi:hypothetical protein